MDAELLGQFVAEAGDLLKEASDGLLQLERAPTDAELMNRVFRAVHTVKGASGLFPIRPFTAAVHAAEDLLTAAREGRIVLAAEDMDGLLAAVDQSEKWVGALADDGRLPADAATVAEALAGRLRTRLEAATGAAAAAGPSLPTTCDWLERVPEDVRAAAAERVKDGEAVVAVRYEPDAGCFFRGDDPLLVMRGLPGCFWGETEPVGPWPAPGDLDPYQCALRFYALATASPADLQHHLRYVHEHCQLAAPDFAPPPAPVEDDPAAKQRARFARLVQQLLDGLGAAGPADEWEGRVASVCATLRNALTAMGQGAQAEALGPAARQAVERRSAEPLRTVLRALLEPPAANAAAGADESADGKVGRTLRVSQDKVDRIMNLAGQLVVAKNALPFVAARILDESVDRRTLARELKDRAATVDRISSELQQAVMAMRLLPVSQIFQRFPRLVRDLSRKLGKPVELEMEGGETEADKQVVEQLADPLIHLVRNSLDHGIEPPEVRAEAGKPATARILLRARQEGDVVVLEVSDDGKGIDPAGVRAHAVKKGVVTQAEADAMSDNEAQRLIFAPGFSTKEAVTDLSGRGVGMDVVRTVVEQAGGRVEVQSKVGTGTTVRLVLPLTMAVARVLTVEADGRLFGVPLEQVAETVRVPRGLIHRVLDREAVVLRESVVPVARLDQLLGLATDPDAPESETDDEALMVVNLGGQRVGVVVEAFRERMEVVVSPMDGLLAGVHGYAGTALLGDGGILPVLDLRALV